MLSLWSPVREFIRRLATPSPDPPTRSDVRSAHVRSLHLLLRNLTPQQRAQYERFSHFDVIGSESGRTYRIRYGTQLNIEELDRTGRRWRLLCFRPKGLLPVGDIMLAQKLALELFEMDAMRIAHKTPAPQATLIAELRSRRSLRQ